MSNTRLGQSIRGCKVILTTADRMNVGYKQNVGALMSAALARIAECMI